MDLTDRADLDIPNGEDGIAAGMIAGMGGNGGVIGAGQIQPAEEGFHSALESEEVGFAAVAAYHKDSLFLRQILALAGKVLAGDLVEPCFGIAVIVVAGQGIQHAGQPRGAHDGGILAERIGDDDGSAHGMIGRQADLIVHLGAHEGVGDDLIVAHGDHGVIDAALEILLRRDNGLRRAAQGGGGDLIVAVHTGYFLGDIGLLLQISAVAGNDALIAHHGDLQGTQRFHHLLTGEGDAEETVHPVGIEGDAAQGMVGVVDIDDAGNHLTGAQLLHQLQGAQQGAFAVHGVQTFFKAAGGFGAHPQLFGGEADAAALEAGGFKDDGIGVIVDAAVFAAHDARYGAGLFGIGNDQHLRGELPHGAIQGGDGLARGGIAYHDLAVLDILEIEGVHGLAVFQHDIVGDIDDVIDGADTAGTQALLQPAGRGRYLDIADDGRHIALAELGIFHPDLQQVVYIAAGALYHGGMQMQRQAVGCSGFPCQTNDGKAIGTVGGDFEFHDGIIEADGGADVLADGAGFLQDEDAVLDSVGEIVGGEPQLLERAEHTVGFHAAQLAAGNGDAAGQVGFVQGSGDQIAHMDILGAGDDLYWL